jgi:hypothetical protein
VFLAGIPMNDRFSHGAIDPEAIDKKRPQPDLDESGRRQLVAWKGEVWEQAAECG